MLVGLRLLVHALLSDFKEACGSRKSCGLALFFDLLCLSYIPTPSLHQYTGFSACARCCCSWCCYPKPFPPPLLFLPRAQRRSSSHHAPRLASSPSATGAR